VNSRDAIFKCDKSNIRTEDEVLPG
jgi:hypothetical protein